jgi:hypothetical protein
MISSFLRARVSKLIAFSVCLAMSVAVGDEKGGETELLKEVQGTWVRKQQSPNGLVTIIKDHTGTKTILTAYDDQKNVIYSHTSEFTVEPSGKVNVFMFRNRTITAGPNAGQTIVEPVSFIFRIANNQFIEVQGVLRGDTNPPNMLIWERVKEDAS